MKTIFFALALCFIPFTVPAEDWWEAPEYQPVPCETAPLPVDDSDALAPSLPFRQILVTQKQASIQTVRVH